MAAIGTDDSCPAVAAIVFYFMKIVHAKFVFLGHAVLFILLLIRLIAPLLLTTFP